jgi:hypothetical protein
VLKALEDKYFSLDMKNNRSTQPNQVCSPLNTPKPALLSIGLTQILGTRYDRYYEGYYYNVLFGREV